MRMWKRCGIAALALLLALLTVASALPVALTEAEMEQFYTLSDLLTDNWERESLDLLRDVEEEYDSTAEELMEFLRTAAAADTHHVWIPVHGGKKYHREEDCSQMIDPRPTTITRAKEIGFTACKRCKPEK